MTAIMMLVTAMSTVAVVAQPVITQAVIAQPVVAQSVVAQNYSLSGPKAVVCLDTNCFNTTSLSYMDGWFANTSVIWVADHPYHPF